VPGCQKKREVLLVMTSREQQQDGWLQGFRDACEQISKMSWDWVPRMLSVCRSRSRLRSSVNKVRTKPKDEHQTNDGSNF